MALILKPTPDVDQYVLWDIDAGLAILVGDRAAVSLADDVDTDRLDRADATGSSSKKGEGAWGTAGLVVNGVRGNGFLPRENLAGYLERLMDDERWYAEHDFVVPSSGDAVTAS